MTIISSSGQLLHHIQDLSPRLIAIDGRLGSGKSTLARSLSKSLGIACLHLDDYLSHGKGAFIRNLDMPAIKNRIQHRPLIVEGVCLVAVFDQLEIPDTPFLIYVKGFEAPNRTEDAIIFDEVYRYEQAYSPDRIARVVYMNESHSSLNSYDVDVAYIKAKTTVSIALAVGGILSIFSGVLVFMLGLSGDDSALVKVAGAEFSSKGLGGVILTTSVLWAYFSYLARPKYSQRQESTVNQRNDGSYEKYELRSSTVVAARPKREAFSPIATEADSKGPSDDEWL